MFFVLSRARDKENILSPHEESNLSGKVSERGIRRSEVRFLMGNHNFFPHARGKTKNIFLHSFTELKTYHLSYSIYKHDWCL